MANEIKFRSEMPRIKNLDRGDAFLISRADGTAGYTLLSDATEFKGEPFIYTDFTAEELEALRGHKGEPFIYTDFTASQIENLQQPAVAAALYATQQGDAAGQAVLTIGERIDMGVAALVGTAPDALDTLQELATAIGNDPNFAATMLNEIAKRCQNNDLRLSDARNVINQAGGAVKIWTGTQAQYDALAKQNDTLYFIS